jgi:hypothetical protein
MLALMASGAAAPVDGVVNNGDEVGNDSNKKMRRDVNELTGSADQAGAVVQPRHTQC